MMIDYLKKSVGFIRVYARQQDRWGLRGSFKADEIVALKNSLPDWEFHTICYTDRSRNIEEFPTYYCQKLFDYVDLDRPQQKQSLLDSNIPMPDFIIETSPSHYQLFWKPGKVDTLTLSNILSTDRGAKEGEQYVRLPFGINIKNGHIIKEVNYNYFMEN